MSSCIVVDCGRPVHGHGLCGTHYKQRRNGKVPAPFRARRKGARCDFQGCGRPHYGHGLCEAHLSQRERGQELRAITPRGVVTSCGFEGCLDTPLAKGLCSAHYAQRRRGVVLHAVERPSPRSDLCGFPGCNDKVKARGLCGAHYRQARRASAPTCAFDGCDGVVLAKGLCAGHYTQQRKGFGLTPLRPAVVVDPGMVFGLWTVLRLEPARGRSHRVAVVRCQCGVEVPQSVYALTGGVTSGCHRCRAPRRDAVPHWSGSGEMSGRYWGTVKANAGIRGLVVSVSKEDVWDLFESQNRRCALSGAPLTMTRPQTASLDRIDSSRGYEPGNVQWIHKVLNRMKGDMDEGDFIAWCRDVSRHS